MTIEEMKARHEALLALGTEINHSPAHPWEFLREMYWIRRELSRYENKIARQSAIINEMPKCANCGEPAVIRVGKIEDNEMICTKCGDILMTMFRGQQWKNQQLDARAQEMKLKRERS